VIVTKHAGIISVQEKSMELFAENFSQALQQIEISRTDRVRRAHLEVRERIQESSQLKLWGVDPILIGSYARNTSIYPGKDVDVFCRMTEIDVSMSPKEVYGTLLSHLVNKFGADRIEPQRRSVKVRFKFEKENDDFWIDAVPAVRYGVIWAIPTSRTDVWDDTASPKRWLETDPERLSALVSERNREPKVNAQGAFVPTVKLVKQIREHHLGDKGPGGLFFEIMTYWAFDRGVHAKSFAEILVAVLRLIVSQLDELPSRPLVDPVLQRPFDPIPKVSEILAAHKIMTDLASEAHGALQLDRCPAAAVWRKIIGRNTRGWCFGLPDGCDELGKSILPVVSVLSKGPKEAHGFG